MVEPLVIYKGRIEGKGKAEDNSYINTKKGKGAVLQHKIFRHESLTPNVLLLNIS